MKNKTPETASSPTKAFAEWIAALPKGRMDQKQTVLIKLTLSTSDWLTMVEVATSRGISIDEVASETISEGADIVEMTNDKAEEA